MAYIAFTEAQIEHVVQTGFGSAVPAPQPVRFSALEWSVVAIAQKDRLASLRSPGRLSLALGAVFGGRRQSRLSDEKLEALRRMAVLAWHRGYAVAPHEVRAFVDAGWSLDHYELLLRSISAARPQPGRRTPR